MARWIRELGIMNLKWLFNWHRGAVLRARGMSDEELLAAFDVPGDHPVLQGVLELVDRAKDDCAREACGAVASDRETAFYLGGRYALENLEGYLAGLRAEAERKRGDR